MVLWKGIKGKCVKILSVRKERERRKGSETSRELIGKFSDQGPGGGKRGTRPKEVREKRLLTCAERNGQR